MEEFDRDLSIEQRCPLCGGDNHCAMAGSQTQQACWCNSVTIDPGVLESLPESSRGKACLCEKCCRTGARTNEG